MSLVQAVGQRSLASTWCDKEDELDIRSKQDTVASWSVVLFTVLDGYATPIPGVSIGLVVFVLGMLYLALSGFRWSLSGGMLTLVVLYTCLSPLLMYVFPIESFFSYAYIEIILRLLKWVFCIALFIMLGAWRAVSRERIVSCMRIIVYSAAAYLCLQRVLYTGGVVIANPLEPFVRLEAYDASNYTMGVGGLFRPSAFFLEPSHASQFALAFLTWRLFDAKVHSDSSKIRFLDMVCPGVVLLATGSLMGFLGLFSLLFASTILNARRKQVVAIAVTVVSVAILLFLLRTDYFQEVLARMLTGGEQYGGNSVQARVGDGFDYLFSKSGMAILFGSGYGNVTSDTYYNGVTFVLNSLGIVGAILLIVGLAWCFTRGDRFQKAAVALYAVLMVGAQLFAPASLLYFALMLADGREALALDCGRNDAEARRRSA